MHLLIASSVSFISLSVNFTDLLIAARPMLLIVKLHLMCAVTPVFRFRFQQLGRISSESFCSEIIQTTICVFVKKNVQCRFSVATLRQNVKLSKLIILLQLRRATLLSFHGSLFHLQCPAMQCVRCEATNCNF